MFADISDGQIQSNNLNSQIATYFKEKYDMQLTGIGLSAPKGIILKLEITFDLKRNLKKEESRKLILECIEKYLDTINENKEIRNSLSCYPFNEKNIQISIFLIEQNGESYRFPEIGIVELYKGNIVYKYIEQLPSYAHKEYKKETYEEALKLVKSSNQN